MKKIYSAIASIAIAAVAFNASAQNFNSGYFLENFNYRYQMNPAFGNEKNFVSMPALGNFNAGLTGNLDLTDIIYNVDGKTVLFTNPQISAQEALCHIGDRNRLGFNTNINVLSGGFKAFKGYNTITIGVRADVNAVLPGSFFSLVKEGVSNQTYNIKDLRANAIGYAQIALQHSHEIIPGLQVGAAFKFLIGAANVQANFNDAYLTLGEDDWTAVTNADVYVNLPKFRYKEKYNDKTHQNYVSGVDMKGEGSYGPNGYGVAFDLGVAYQWNDWQFSVAALDLGFINFRNTQYASTNGTQTFHTDAYTFNVNDDAPNSFSNEWDNLVGDFDKLYQLQNNGNIGNHTRTLAATLNIGLNYRLPVYRKLNFGFLSSTRFLGDYAYSEARFSANVMPVKCFSADVNFCASTFGTSFGWMLNYYNTGFSLFLGMDHTNVKVSKQYVPLRSNLAVNVGINFPF